MAATVIPDEGKKKWNAWAANANPTDTLTVRIAKNDFVIDDATVLGDFTEADWPGYSSFAFVRGDLSAAAIVAHVSEMGLTPPPSFVHTGGADQDVYSWYLTDDTASVCLAAAPFDATITMRPGASLTLDPFKIKLKGF